MASEIADYCRAQYAADPRYRLQRLNYQRKYTGRPALTLDELPPHRPYKRTR